MADNPAAWPMNIFAAKAATQREVTRGAVAVAAGVVAIDLGIARCRDTVADDDPAAILETVSFCNSVDLDVTLLVDESMQGGGDGATEQETADHLEDDGIAGTHQPATCSSAEEGPLAIAQRIADAWGASPHWEDPYIDDDPFEGQLAELVGAGNPGTRRLREAMESACAGSADRILSAIDRVDADWVALIDRLECSADPLRSEGIGALDALRGATTLDARYAAIRRLLSSMDAEQAESWLAQVRDGFGGLAGIRPFKPAGRLFVGSNSTRCFPEMVVDAARTGETHMLEHWKAKGKYDCWIAAEVDADFADRFRTLGRTRAVDVLTACLALEQVWRFGADSAGTGVAVPIPLNQVVSAVLATEATGGRGRRARNQTYIRRYLRGLIEALRTVRVSWHVFDFDLKGYRDESVPLIGVIGPGTFHDVRGNPMPDTWVAVRDPIAILSDRTVSKIYEMPLPHVEPFDLADAGLYNLILRELGTLDWEVEKGMGRPGPNKSVKIGRDVLVNGGMVPAVEGSDRKGSPRGGPVLVTHETVRSRRYRELQKIEKSLEKVADAILEGRRQKGRPPVKIEPVRVAGGNSAVPSLDAVILEGTRTGKGKRSRKAG